jgi:diguanylate cyclase (GGDEF)-like protein
MRRTTRTGTSIGARLAPAGLTALALVLLYQADAVGDLPLWILFSLLTLGAATSEFFRRELAHEAPSTLRIHCAVAAQILSVTALIYAIGWGAALSIGYVFILSTRLDDCGARVWRATVGWALVGMALGQCAIARGIVATYVPEPDVHVLALLEALGLVFIMRRFGMKTAQYEQSTRQRDDAHRELRSTLSLLTATLDATADGIVAVSPDGTVERFNAQFARMWPAPLDVATPQAQLDAVNSVLDQLLRPDAFLATFKELEAHPEAESEDTIEFKDGRVFERRARPRRVDDQVVGRVWSYRDVTDTTRLVDELVHQAFHDGLTGLANRALLRDRLEHALARARRSGATVAVLFCDLDGFKMVNDALGHGAGDELLHAVARRLEHRLRESDTVARLGGDEFAIVLDETTLERATTLASRTLDLFADPFLVGDREIFIRGSIGIAESFAGTIDADDLLCRADIAMYAAKARGRNRFETFENRMQIDLSNRHELYRDLRHALQTRQFRVYYQPLLNLDGNQVESVEALLRWRHPERGIVGPEEIIPLAEETGLIIELGAWVLRESCRQLAEWSPILGEHVDMSVNVSAHQLYHETFVDDVAAALADSKLAGSRLILEVTESTLLSDTTLVQERLTALQALGVRIAIDDFGTGYSSLAYLHTFAVDVLKIDRSFVHDLLDSASGRGSHIVNSIVGIAQKLGLGVVAEGIEEEAELAALKDIGCESGQGFLFAPPLPPEKIPLVIQRLNRARVAVEVAADEAR